MAQQAVTLDTAQLARLLDITPRHIQRLAADSVLVRARDETGRALQGRWEMIPNVHGYIKHLRGQARLDDSGDATFVGLRNSRLRSEAEMAALRLNQLKGELLRRDDVDFWIGNALTAFKSRVQSIAARVSRLLVGQTNFRVIFDTISTETNLALNELSQLNSSQFSAQSEAFLAAQGADRAQLNGQETQDEDTGEQDAVAGGFEPEADD